MALRDVKEYYYKVAALYAESKADFEDFEKGLADGYVTEEKVLEVKEELNNLEINFNRLAYIMYLFELPNRKSKQDKYKKANKKVGDALAERGADEEAVLNESKSALDNFRKSLKELKK